MRDLLQHKSRVGIILLIILIALYNTTPISGAFSIIKRPIAWAGSFFYSAGKPINNFVFAITKGTDLIKRQEQQEKQIVSLIFELEQIKANNKFYGKNFTELSNLFVSTIIESKVISSQFNAGKHIILINKGTKDGIVAGAPVITEQAIFVGKVIQVDKNSSAILLVTDSSSAIASALSSDMSVQSIVRGKKGISLDMELIPQDADLQTGNIVVTSLLEENTPQGLLIGQIASVKYTEGELFKTATLSPFVSISSLSNVGVIIPIDLKQ
ncbi:rod shape-determining protein MreC [Patescibacteria group bacterium]|nr:rod shape-determining protein MreC [Patescibacteria group bacterium]